MQGASPSPAPVAPSPAVAAATPQDAPVTVVLEPRHEAVLSAQVAARVLAVNREMGQRFDEGQVLVQMDDRAYRAVVERTTARLNAARAQLTAKERLYRDGSLSDVELEDARAVEALARAELTQAQIDLASCTVAAPFPGRVADLRTNPHEFVRIGQELLQVVDDRSLLGQFLVPSRLLPRLTLGRRVPILLDETGLRVEGTVSHIGAIIDPASSTLRVSVEVPNPDGTLCGGMRGTLSLDDLAEPETPR